MKQASNALKNLLLSKQLFYMSDLFTITLLNETILRYTNCDIPLTVDGNQYSPMLITRNGTTQTRGMNVDELTLTITTDSNNVIPGDLTFMQGVAAGTFDNSILRIDRVFSPTPFIFNMPPINSDYTLLWWIGIFNIESAGGITVEAIASSMLQLLNVKFPRNLYYPSCIKTLGDSECGVNLANFKTHDTAQAGSSKSKVIGNISLANGYLNQGTITFTSGKNTGVSRSIRSNSGNLILPVIPFSNEVAAGDTFTVTPSCWKMMSRCKSLFNNLAQFRGYPFIPVPETSY